MDSFTVFPDKPIRDAGPISRTFLGLGVATFHDACRRVRGMPYGYNSNRDDPMTLFTEGRGSCTTKHAVIALLAMELGIPVEKRVGVYAMTEDLVDGAGEIARRHGLPHVPMIHCFLASGPHRVDLTEGNRNGKNRAVDVFLHQERVSPDISEKEEYLLYRRALSEKILKTGDLAGVDVKRVLQAREEGIRLLRAKVSGDASQAGEEKTA